MIPESVWSMALVYIIGIVIFILAGWLIVLGVITGQIKHLKKENILQLEESRKVKKNKYMMQAYRKAISVELNRGKFL